MTDEDSSETTDYLSETKADETGEDHVNSPHPFDTIVVGGGPAGLSAALGLGRCLRKVVVCDAGKPRNAAAKVFNGYLSRDGASPHEFLEISRGQLKRYETVEIRKALVVGIEGVPQGFTVELDSGERLTARTILLATGLVDELPQIEGIRQFYGETVHSCPYCDAWELRGSALAVLGGSQEAADLALELLLWTRDIILCTYGVKASFSQETRSTMLRAGIKILDASVQRLEGKGGQLEGVRFNDGTFLPRRGAFFSPGQFQRSNLAEQLGCKACDEEIGCIRCGEDTATNVPGVYAAGNCTKGVQLVIAAVAEGMRAAFAINDALLEKDLNALKGSRGFEL